MDTKFIDSIGYLEKFQTSQKNALTVYGKEKESSR